MHKRILDVLLAMLFAYGMTLRPASAAEIEETSGKSPVVVGYGVGLFDVGALIAQDNFENLDNWVVQVQQRAGDDSARVMARNHSLDCFLPGRGCTAWYRKKLPTRVTITYDVLCPTHDSTIEGLQPRDINNFWMASDPADPQQGLFDPERYTGAFKSYHKIYGYYASTGGRNNRTTRMRRYPREIDGRPADHVALTDKDEKPGFLITPDKVMSVQLVAYDDVIQYIVNDRLTYQMRHGDEIQLEGRDDEGKSTLRKADYDSDRFPVYREGFFGFRMVGTHHVYSNFKVYALKPAKAASGKPVPVKAKAADRVNAGSQRPIVRVSSLDELREAVAESNQQIVLQSGRYKVSDRRGMQLSGSNNDVDLSGAYIEVPMDVASGNTLLRMTGNGITLRGGTIEDTYPDGRIEIKDFGQYNQDRKFGGMNEIAISGDDNQVIGLTMTVRGSFPYGYGNMYGIGAGSVVRLRKHCGIQITGNRAVIDGCRIKMEAFGHAIYVQGGDRTTVRNTFVEGTLRPSNDCYNETDEGDLAKRFDYQMQWPEEVRGLPIPRDHMLHCTEDGIRAYRGAGEMIVENCVVKKCRGGIKLYMAKSAKVSNCQVMDCVVQGYSVPSRGVISNSSGNAAYGPLLYVHFDKHSDQKIELEVLPSPQTLGDHPLAAIRGRGHSIKFTQGGSQTPQQRRPIIVGYPMRFDFLCDDYPDVPDGYEEHFARYAPKSYEASRITIDNETIHPVVLGNLSRDNSVKSIGPIRDLGRNNTTN